MTHPNASYTAPAAASPGMLDCPEVGHDIVSRLVETAAGIGFGKVVSRGTDKDTQVGLGGAVPFGVAARGHEYGNDSSDDEDYDQYSACPVVRAGYLWATIADTADAGTALNYNTTTGAIGAGTAGAGEAMLPGELATDSTAGGLALIWIDCRMSSTAALFTGQVLDTDFDAYTILAADTDNTPAALTVAASRLVGRKSTGGIAALTAAEVKTLLGTNAAKAIDSNVAVLFENIAAQTDESEVSAALDGSASSYFVPTGYLLIVKSASGSVAGDGTINIGTSTGGTQYESAQALTSLDTAGDALYVPLTVGAGAAVAGNATLYFNIEKNDSTATTLVLNCLLFGKQISIA